MFSSNSKTNMEVIDLMSKHVEKVDPLLQHIKQDVSNYNNTKPHDNIKILGSVGNGLIFPETLDDGSYIVELDLIFERLSDKLVLPLIPEHADKTVRVQAVSADVNDDTYVKLMVIGDLPKDISDSDLNSLFIRENKTIFLSNSGFKLRMPLHPNDNIMGETELDQMLNYKLPFRKFRSEQMQVSIAGCTYKYMCLIDKVFAIQLPWPAVAHKWSERKRSWPTQAIIDKVICEGCHVIPKTKSGEQSDNMWKYSFAAAEQTIANCFLPNQRNVFLLVKQLKKKYLERSELPGVTMFSGITSYHLKTTFFWLCEEHGAPWFENDPISIIQAFFDLLIEFLEKQHCPNYFIPTLNIFERLWDKDDIFIYRKDPDQVKNMRLSALLKLTQDLRNNLQSYLTEDLLRVVDESHLKESEQKLKEDFMPKDFYRRLDELGSSFESFQTLDTHGMCKAGKEKSPPP